MLKQSLIILLLGFSAVLAMQARAGGPILPDIPAAQARFSATQGCVEPTEEMRKNHMKYILHKRDQTMHEGIRTTQYSLKECINCHVSAAQDAPRFPSEKHFCNSCHTYAAVTIDCFQCHADRPVKEPQGNAAAPFGNPHHATITGSAASPVNGSTGTLLSEGFAHE
jgi:hypothetical protein